MVRFTWNTFVSWKWSGSLEPIINNTLYTEKKHRRIDKIWSDLDTNLDRA